MIRARLAGYEDAWRFFSCSGATSRSSAKGCFVLHAPRQVGKTTSLLTLATELTREGRDVAALLSMETGAPFAEDPGAAELAILGSSRRALRWQLPGELQPPPVPDGPPGERIGAVQDRAQPITRADVDRAREILIARQDTHLDSLAERLREPRVRALIAEGLEQLDGYLARPRPPARLADDLRPAQRRASDRTRRELARTPAGRDVIVIRA